MEGRESEALCIFDHHDRSVRDIDTDLDHGRRDKDPDLPCSEGRHDSILFIRLHPAMQHGDRKVGKDSFELFRPVDDVFCMDLFIFFDHRADYIDLMSCEQLLLEKAHRIRPPRFIDDTVFDRESCCRSLIHKRNIKISVVDHTQRPGNRRR